MDAPDVYFQESEMAWLKLKCAVCGDSFYAHQDGSYRCGCLPDSNDPQGQEYEDRKLEARMIATRENLKKFPKLPDLPEENIAWWFQAW